MRVNFTAVFSFVTDTRWLEVLPDETVDGMNKKKQHRIILVLPKTNTKKEKQKTMKKIQLKMSIVSQRRKIADIENKLKKSDKKKKNVKKAVEALKSPK